MRIKWTEEEDKVVRAFWESDRPRHEAESILPGRTLMAVKKRVAKIGCKHREPGPHPMMRARILDAIEMHAPISAAALSDMFLCEPQQIDNHIRELHRMREIRIDGHHREGISVTRLWGAGKEPDAKRPLTKAQLRAEAKANKPRGAVQVRDGKVINSHHRAEIRIPPQWDALTAALFGSRA